MSSPEHRHSMSVTGVTSPDMPGPLDLFKDPIGGSIVSPGYGYMMARNTATAEFRNQQMSDYNPGVYDAREDLTHLAGEAFAAEATFEPQKRPRVMEERFRLGFDTFVLAVIKADPTHVEDLGARVPRNTESLRALQTALGYREDRDPAYHQIPLDSLKRIFAQSERELGPSYVRGPRLVSTDYREEKSVPLYYGQPKRARTKVDIGKEAKLPGLKNICQRFVAVAVSDTGGLLARTHAVQGGSDAYEGMLLGGIVAKNIVLEMALEELSCLPRERSQAAYL